MLEEDKNCPNLAVIRPFEYQDEETRDKINVSVSPFYSIFTVNNHEYFFLDRKSVV